MGKRSTQTCPKKLGSIIVRVRQEVSRAGLGGCPVSISGPTPGAKTTNPAGVAEFAGLSHGSYEIKITLSRDAVQKHYKLASYTTTVSVSQPKPPVWVEAFARPPSTLRTKVIWKKPLRDGRLLDQLLDNMKVKIAGPAATDKATGKDGNAVFADIESGNYTVSAELLGVQLDRFLAPASVTVTLPPGETREVVLEPVPLGTLRVVLFDKNAKGISGKAWSLSGPVSARGTTGADGLIEVKKVPLTRGNARLNVIMGTPRVPPKPPAPAPSGPAPAVPPYPPPIKAADFKDKGPDLATAPDTSRVTWVMQLSLLSDLSGDAGVKERLQNMGFMVAGLSGPPLERKVKAYQKAHMQQDQGSGNFADIKGHVIDRHDNP